MGWKWVSHGLHVSHVPEDAQPLEGEMCSLDSSLYEHSELALFQLHVLQVNLLNKRFRKKIIISFVFCLNLPENSVSWQIDVFYQQDETKTTL